MGRLLLFFVISQILLEPSAPAMSGRVRSSEITAARLKTHLNNPYVKEIYELESPDLRQQIEESEIFFNSWRLSELYLGDEGIWLDGEVVKHLAEDYRNWGGIDLGAVFDQLVGVKIQRMEDHSVFLIHSEEAITIEIPKMVQETLPGGFKLYAIDIPKTVQFIVNYEEDLLKIRSVIFGKDGVDFRIKIPIISDKVFIRALHINLETGMASIEARVMQKYFGVIMQANVYDRKYQGVQTWETLKRNFSNFFRWVKTY